MDMQRIFIEIVYQANAVQMGFRDPEKARAAYDKISAALREYRPFKNDRTETVEVDTENGLSTLKLENMNAVLFNGDRGGPAARKVVARQASRTRASSISGGARSVAGEPRYINRRMRSKPRPPPAAEKTCRWRDQPELLSDDE